MPLPRTLRLEWHSAYIYTIICRKSNAHCTNNNEEISHPLSPRPFGALPTSQRDAVNAGEKPQCLHHSNHNFVKNN